MEFKEYEIKDLGNVVGGGTPSTKQVEYYNGDIAWITPKDLSDFSGKYISHGERYITDKGLKKSSARMLPKGTVLMTSRAPIGYLAIAKNELCTNQGFKSVICDEKLIIPEYLYYKLQYKMEYIKGLGTGSTFSEVSGKTVKGISLKIPSIENQIKQIHVLKNIDDKISLNNKIIANLEELSQTLFKHWFVDFEFPDENGNPYKSSGGEMKKSELGELPKGWNYEKAQNLYKITIGKTPPRKIRELFSFKEGVDWVSISDMKDEESFITKTKEKLTNEAVKDYRVKVIPEGTVLLSFKLTVGRVKIASKNLATNEAIAHFVSNEIGKAFTYFYLQQFNFESLGNTSSIANAVNSKIIKNMPFLHPDEKVLKNFVEIVNPFIDKIEALQRENIELTILRDTLLPKLMSGEIEIPDEVEVDENEL